MARKKSGLRIPENFQIILLAVFLFVIGVVLISKLKLVMPPQLSLKPALPTSTPVPTLTKANLGEQIKFSTGLTFEVRDSWILKSNLEKLRLEVYRGTGRDLLDPKKNLLILSVKFENNDKAKQRIYDVRGFALNDENGFPQASVSHGTTNQNRLSSLLPQFKMLDWQRHLLPGQKVEGVILFEVDPKSRFYTLIYRADQAGSAEVEIQNPKVINL
jgi:hypothetical protein